MTITTFVSGLTSTGGIVTDGTYLFISDANGISRVKISDQTQTDFTGMGNGGKIGLYGNYIYSTYMNDNQPNLGRLLFDYNSMTPDSLTVRFNGIQYNPGPDNSYTEFIDNPVDVVGVDGYVFYIHSTGYISRFTIANISDDSVNDEGFGDATSSEHATAGYRDLGGALTGASPSSLASDGSTSSDGYIYIYIGCSTKIVRMSLDGTSSYGPIVTGLSHAVSALSVSGNYLYALLSDDTVLKINLTDFTSSELISSGLTSPNSMVNSGDYLYICDGGSVLRSTLTAGGSSDTTLTTFTVDNSSSDKTVDTGTTSINVVAEPNDPNVFSVTIASDVTSAAAVTSAENYTRSVDLNHGANTITVVVTAQDGITESTYTLNVTVTPSTVTTLSNLTVHNNSGLENGFYVYADAGTSQVGITATPTDTYATVTINGTDVTGDTSYYRTIDVYDGDNYVTIRVTAEDETTYTDYTGTVYVTPTDNGGGGGGGNLSTDSSLSSLTVDSDSVTGYSITVGADITSISVAAIPNVSSVQSVTINGTSVSSPNYSTNVSISYGSTGSTDIPIVVMAEDGSSTSYTLTVTMSASNVTTLSAFTINTTSMGTNGGGEITVSYGATVSVYVATTSSYAYIDVNGDTQTIGTKTRTFTGLSVGTHTVTVHIVPQDETTGANYTATVIVTSAASTTCFEENTKILCFNSEKAEEEYVMVKDLRKGHLVKTFASGYKPIDMIGKRDIYHPAVEERIKNQLYKCSNDKYPEIFEDLIITGCHCILVRGFVSDEQKEKSIELNGDLYITDNRYRLPACIDDKSTVYEEAGNYTIYHLALENDDYYMNYGIYANGLLVETCSKRYLKEVSGMDLLE